MRPAYSVIFFTTASGAGYGLLALMGILNTGGYLPADRWFGLSGFIIALGLVTFGLLASTFHLGHPKRSWRALSQWRTSWLSREGVVAVLTYVPAGLFAIGWVFLEQTNGFWMMMGILAAIGAAMTVFCTSMIYASLRAIPAWTHQLVSPLYLVLGLAMGGLLLDNLLRLWGSAISGISILCMLALIIGLALKIKYWQTIDVEPRETNIASATGLGNIGTVRVLDKPHTSENYLQQEMGFRVARKHAGKLRRIVIALFFIGPILLLAISLLVPGLALATPILAIFIAAIGNVAERWLFFAEAKHVVMNYYQD